MLKQSSSRMKKALAVLLAVLFVASLTAVAVSARGGGGWGGRGGWGGYGGWGMMGAYPYYGYGLGDCGLGLGGCGYGLGYGGYGGVPYMTGQYPAPEISTQAPASTQDQYSNQAPPQNQPPKKQSHKKQPPKDP